MCYFGVSNLHSMLFTNQFGNMLEKGRIYLAGLRRNGGNQFIYICQY